MENGIKIYKWFFIVLSVEVYVNGSQLAKMKKSIPDMSTPWNL